jgi:hypothetical protein
MAGLMAVFRHTYLVAPPTLKQPTHARWTVVTTGISSSHRAPQAMAGHDELVDGSAKRCIQQQQEVHNCHSDERTAAQSFLNLAELSLTAPE